MARKAKDSVEKKPAAKKSVTPSKRTTTAKKATKSPSVKLEPKAPKKTGSVKRARNYKPKAGKFNDFAKMMEKSVDEIEDYLAQCYEVEENEFEDMPTLQEIQFCQAYMSNGFKQGEAVRSFNPDLKTANSVQRAHTYLSRERVQRYLTRELHNRRLRMGITSDWICKKYLAWSTLDITDFIEFTPAKRSGKTTLPAAVHLTKSINDLPPLVRQSIKSLTVDDKGKVKVEFIDQKSALDSLAKMLGFATEKLDINTNQDIHMHFDAQDADA